MAVNDEPGVQTKKKLQGGDYPENGWTLTNSERIVFWGGLTKRVGAEGVEPPLLRQGIGLYEGRNAKERFVSMHDTLEMSGIVAEGSRSQPTRRKKVGRPKGGQNSNF